MKQSIWKSLWERVRHSPWVPLIGRGAVGIAVLLVLAWIGRGAAQRVPIPGEQGPVVATVEPAALPQVVLATAPTPSAPCEKKGEDGASGFLPDGRLVLNQATAADLEKLPGIGTKRAAAILALRERLGGKFRRLRDLMRVRGIGPRSLAKLRPRLVLDPPPPPEDEA